MKKIIFALFAALLLLGCTQAPAPTATPEPTAATAAPILIPTITVPTTTITPTATSTPIATPTTQPTVVASSTPSATPAPTSTIAPTPTPTTVPTTQVVHVNIVAKQFSFQPNEVRVKQGAKVELEVSVPSGDVTHGISIPEFGVNEVVSPGQTKTIQFTANKPPGTYNFFCSVFCGSGHGGMSGKIVVE